MASIPLSTEDFIQDYLNQLKQNKKISNRLKDITQKFLVDLNHVYSSIENTAFKLCLSNIDNSDPLDFAISCLYVASSLTCRKFFGVIVISKEEFLDILGGSLSLFHKYYKKILLNMPKFM